MALPERNSPAWRERYEPITGLVAIAWLQSEERHGNSAAAAAWVLRELERYQAMEVRAINMRDQAAPPYRSGVRAAIESDAAKRILGEG